MTQTVTFRKPQPLSEAALILACDRPQCWGGLESGSDGLSLTSGGCSADAEPATRPQYAHIDTHTVIKLHTLKFLPAIRLQALFHYCPLMYDRSDDRILRA